MKRFLISVSLLLSVIMVKAQTDEQGYEDGKWVLKGVTGINISQSSFSNWSAGGENSLAGNIFLNGSLVRKSGNWLWQNTLVLDYGLSKTKSTGNRKTSDVINFATQLGYTTDNKWFYTIMGDLKTQFYKGYNYPNKDVYISKFFAPAYSNISLGMEYRPKANYSIYLSPVAGKMTFVTDDLLSDSGAFGVDPGDKFKAEFGAYFKARMEQTIMENVNLVTTADFFTAYDKSFGNVDINWDVLISMKINKFLSANINTTLQYDDDVKYINSAGEKEGPKVQFKEIIGVGLSYNF
ncbi:MAG: DUF3078 domain-containing protein [Bacteroides sp.]|nr:DUF3078 domain-containing protein [Bacteroides sp.]